MLISDLLETLNPPGSPAVMPDLERQPPISLELLYKLFNAGHAIYVEAGESESADFVGILRWIEWDDTDIDTVMLHCKKGSAESESAVGVGDFEDANLVQSRGGWTLSVPT
jgi:hypothetical protein